MPRVLSILVLVLCTFFSAPFAAAETSSADPWPGQVEALGQVDAEDGHYVVGLVVFVFMNEDTGNSDDPMSGILRQAAGFRALTDAARKVDWPEMGDALQVMAEQIEQTGGFEEASFESVMAAMGQLDDGQLEAQLGEHEDRIEGLRAALRTHIDQTVAQP